MFVFTFYMAINRNIVYATESGCRL